MLGLILSHVRFDSVLHWANKIYAKFKAGTIRHQDFPRRRKEPTTREKTIRYIVLVRPWISNGNGL